MSSLYTSKYDDITSMDEDITSKDDDITVIHKRICMNIQNDVWKTNLNVQKSGSVAVQQCLVTIVKLCIEQCELHTTHIYLAWEIQ